MQVSEFALLISVSLQALSVKRPPISFKSSLDVVQNCHFSVLNTTAHLDHQPNPCIDGKVAPDPVMVTCG